MKKTSLALLLLLSLSVTMIGCNKSKNAVENTLNQNEQETESNKQKSKLTRQERIDVFNAKLEKVQEIYDKYNISYTPITSDYSKNPNTIGISFTNSNLQLSKQVSWNTMTLNYENDDNGPEAKATKIFYLINFELDMQDLDNFDNDKFDWDFSKTCFPEVYKELTGRELDIEWFTKEIISIDKDNYHIRNYDYDLKPYASLLDEGPKFMSISVDSDILIKLYIDFDMFIEHLKPQANNGDNKKPTSSNTESSSHDKDSSANIEKIYTDNYKILGKYMLDSGLIKTEKYAVLNEGELTTKGFSYIKRDDDVTDKNFESIFYYPEFNRDNKMYKTLLNATINVDYDDILANGFKIEDTSLNDIVTLFLPNIKTQLINTNISNSYKNLNGKMYLKFDSYDDSSVYFNIDKDQIELSISYYRSN